MASTFSFSSFQASYRYKIGGTYNASYANVARAVGNEDVEKRLKSRLTSNTIQIANIKNSGADADSINKQVGQTRLTYLRTASQELYNVRSNSESLSGFRAAINSMSKDLETAINEYTSSTTRTAAEDAKFKENADYILRKLTAMYTTIKGRSAAAGTRFDINMYQANRRIDSLRSLLGNFPAAGSAPAAAPEAVEGGDDGSISGTTASTGNTVDVTA